MTIYSIGHSNRPLDATLALLARHEIRRVDRSMQTITQWDRFACYLIRIIRDIERYEKEKVVKNSLSTLRWLRELEPEERTFD